MSSEPEGAGFDIGSLLSQLGQVQQNLQEAQQEAAAREVEGSSGGGAVKVRVSGALEFLDVEIDPSVVDPADVELLEDLVLAAVRDGLEQASGLATSALGQSLPGGFGGLQSFGGLAGFGGFGGAGESRGGAGEAGGGGELGAGDSPDE